MPAAVGNLSYSFGSITLNEPQWYEVTYGVSIFDSSGLFGLLLNGSEVQGSELSTVLSTQMSTLSIIVDVSSVPATLQVVNLSGSGVSLGSSSSAVTSYITVKKLQ